MHKEYILLNGFRKAQKGFTAGFHVPLNNYVAPPIECWKNTLFPPTAVSD